MKNNLGQYFTTNTTLKEVMYNFILNNPSEILEPSIGQGHLISFIKNKNNDIKFDMYEIDNTIQLLNDIQKENVIYKDFLKENITKTYNTIIGNPPYIKSKNGNLYINFIEKCYNLLNPNGELIFITPSDFFKLTSAANLLNTMMSNGTFTHIFHPNNENLFKNASIDILIFRYCKNTQPNNTTLYNNIPLHITNTNGLITFGNQNNTIPLKDFFDIYVGLVSGKEKVFKNETLGNIQLITGENTAQKYIFIDSYPTDNKELNEYLLNNKEELLKRKIKKFNETNWFSWGAPRNLKTILKHKGEECIYIHNLSRKQNIAFIGTINYFNGNLLMLKPKRSCNLTNITSYLNTDSFKNNFTFSGRFKIGHRQLLNSQLPNP
jgi:adenine-specific DNA-methyltransferase